MRDLLRAFAAVSACVMASAVLAQDGAPPPPVVAPQPAAPTPVPVPGGPAVQSKELDGGLLVEDLVIGQGYEVPEGGAVVALYHGTLKDGGKVFDSAFDRGEPIAFPLANVIPGWQKGVPGMKVGGVRRLTIPSALAYGERGAGADIPPHADLVFVIKMVDALQVIDVVVGQGEAAEQQCVAVTKHAFTDTGGSVVAASPADQPYIWLPGEHQGINAGLVGMKVGGKRKLVIPAQFNVSPPMLETAWPQNVSITCELELLAVRNLK